MTEPNEHLSKDEREAFIEEVHWHLKETGLNWMLVGTTFGATMATISTQTDAWVGWVVAVPIGLGFYFTLWKTTKRRATKWVNSFSQPSD